ncbi:MAG: DUF1178 family protein [Methyloceanibacter sp.]
MIRFALLCDHGHEFDGWFASGEAYEDQARTHAVMCPCCGSHVVRKAPMAPAVRKRRTEPSLDRGPAERKKTYALLKGLRAHIEANAENVGPAFPEEARKMHYGEAETRGIYGEASLEEARSLQEEGIPALPLPPLPEDHN